MIAQGKANRGAAVGWRRPGFVSNQTIVREDSVI